MKYLLALLIGLLFPASALATTLVQQSSPVYGSSSPFTIGFANPTTLGNIVVVWVGSKSGSSTVTSITGLSNSFTKIADSGSNASTSRFETYCGPVSISGTTLTVVTSATVTAQAAEFTGYTCTLDGSAEVASTTGATSITPTGLATSNAHDLLLAGASHLTAEGVTDGSTGYTALIAYSAKSPTLSADYQAVSSTGTYTPTWSWATSSGAGAASVAVEAGSNFCIGGDACVQYSPPVHGTTAPNPQLGANTTTGDVLIAVITMTTSGTATISGNATTWTLIGDSGSNGSSGRTILECGIVTTPGTGVTISTSVNSGAQLIEFRGMTCTTDATAITAHNTAATSTALSTYTTNASQQNIFLVATGHSTAEAVTDNSSPALNQLSTLSAQVPTLNVDYIQSTQSTTFSPAFSWSTSSHYGAVAVAIETASKTIAQASFQQWPQGTPIAAPTPSTPNQGIFDFVGQTATVPSPFPANVQGMAWNVTWNTLEPQQNVYNWTPITNFLSLLPNNTYAEISILTGAESPTWLQGAGVTGITAYWTQKSVFPQCTQVFEPYPGDATYISALESFMTAFATEFAGNTQIAMVSISPSSFPGGDVTLAASSSIASCTANYSSQWNTISVANGCSSGSESCWRGLVLAGMESLCNYEIVALRGFNLAEWITAPALFGTVNGTTDGEINSSYFSYVAANPPAIDRIYISQEALSVSNYAWNLMSPYINSNLAAGAQTVSAFENGSGNCSSTLTQCECYCLAGTTYGAYNGMQFLQLYNANITGSNACTAQTAKIAAALNGTSGETCP